MIAGFFTEDCILCHLKQFLQLFAAGALIQVLPGAPRVQISAYLRMQFAYTRFVRFFVGFHIYFHDCSLEPALVTPQRSPGFLCRAPGSRPRSFLTVNALRADVFPSGLRRVRLHTDLHSTMDRALHQGFVRATEGSAFFLTTELPVSKANPSPALTPLAG